MSPARSAACAAILAAIWLGTAWADSHFIHVTLPAPATLSAELSTPRGTGPFPAVILLHGCGGVGANVKEWAVWLQHEASSSPTWVGTCWRARRKRASSARATVSW